ncbi:MAG TPA: hypothetical protein VK968_03500 [Roseimicrobium sp.]|nr:hypothetical protein [Roseimicrobium sp.]
MKENMKNQEQRADVVAAPRNSLSTHHLRSRREFLKKAVKRGALPTVIVYSALSMKSQAACNYI